LIKIKIHRATLYGLAAKSVAVIEGIMRRGMGGTG
jgi:hypothetical protein